MIKILHTKYLCSNNSSMYLLLNASMCPVSRSISLTVYLFLLAGPIPTVGFFGSLSVL